MATAVKHMERSHMSHKNKVDFSDFERKANLKSSKKKRTGLIQNLFNSFHRTSNK